MKTTDDEHYCQDINNLPIDKFLQIGIGKGRNLLIVGESPAPNGWRKSGKACYTSKGKLLPTGKRLNELLEPYHLSVDVCGFTELVKCHVGKDRKMLTSCSKKCWPIFLQQIKLTNSKLILLLGVKTLEIFNNISKNNLKIGKVAKTTLDNKSVLILPIYHPSPINPHGRIKNQIIFKSNKKVLQKII